MVAKTYINTTESEFNVDLKGLHEDLKIKSKFADWRKRRLKGLIEGVHYVWKNKTALLTYSAGVYIKCLEGSEKGLETLQRQEEVLSKVLNTVLEVKGEVSITPKGDLVVTSKTLSEVLDKKHFHVLRDIRKEIEELEKVVINTEDEETREGALLILNGITLKSYIDSTGRVLDSYELNEDATINILLKYSREVRSKFIHKFKTMRKMIESHQRLSYVHKDIPELVIKDSYVYIIQNTGTGNIKIGVSKNVEARLASLRAGSDFPLELVYVSNVCSNAFEIETLCHEKFKKDYVNLEWYSTNPKDVIDFLSKCRFVLSSNKP